MIFTRRARALGSDPNTWAMEMISAETPEAKFSPERLAEIVRHEERDRQSVKAWNEFQDKSWREAREQRRAEEVEENLRRGREWTEWEASGQRAAFLKNLPSWEEEDAAARAEDEAAAAAKAAK